MSAEAFHVIPSSTQGASQPSQPTLLFVDDEPAILTALRVVFRRGYRILSTTDGEEALQMLATHRVDVIVCDQRMPKITGVEVLSRARSISPMTVRLLLTGYADSESVMGAINDGEVHRFLQKPWDNATLRSNVEQAVAAASQTQATKEANAELRANVNPQPDLNPETPVSTFPPVTSSMPTREAQGMPPAVDNRAPQAQVLPFPLPDRVRVIEPRGDGTSTPRPERENVLIVERDGSLRRDLLSAAENNFSILAARDISEAATVIEHQPARVIVFVLNAQSAFERSFLKLLKIEHPGVIVIAVCEALDTPHMIELINHARIFRFLRYPLATPALLRHLQSAATLAQELRDQPLMLGTQRVSLDAAESKALFEALRLAQGEPTSNRPVLNQRGWLGRLVARLRGMIK